MTIGILYIAFFLSGFLNPMVELKSKATHCVAPYNVTFQFDKKIASATAIAETLSI